MPGDLSKYSNIQTFSKGNLIVRGGENAPRELLVLLRGSIGVYSNYGLASQVQTSVLNQGDFYGELPLFLGNEQVESLVALSDVIVLVVARKNIHEFLTGQSELALTVIEGICRKLDSANDALDKHMLGNLTQTASKTGSLFPDGHGSYLLPLDNANDYMLYTNRYACPLCGHSFDNLNYIVSRLQNDGMDKDLRVRFKDFEPIYYDIVTCPNCFLSTAFDNFEDISKSFASRINEAIGPYRLELEIKTGVHRDTYTVFAGYYLALLCAPILYDDWQLIAANLWLKLSRLYQDCKDEAMARYASQKALEDFRHTYESINISEKITQRVCYMLGALYHRAEEIDLSRTFFHMAKTSKAGSNVIRRQADMRLEEIREQIKAEKEAAAAGAIPT